MKLIDFYPFLNKKVVIVNLITPHDCDIHQVDFYYKHILLIFQSFVVDLISYLLTPY